MPLITVQISSNQRVSGTVVNANYIFDWASVLDANKKLEDVERAIKEIEREALINETQYDFETVKKKFRVKLSSNISSVLPLILLTIQFDG